MLIFTSSTCEAHVNANSPVEAPERYPAMLAGLEIAEKSGAKLEYRDVSPAMQEQLLRVHTERYLDEIRASSESGGGLLDHDTATSERSWEATRFASGAAIGAVEGSMNGEPSFAVVRPPGHHSGSDYAMGFCLTNHAAVAAAHARSLGAERVAVLDWDVHHGNGTQDIFYRRDDVLYLSVHRGGMFYPGTGSIGEVGEGAGEGFTVNVPLRSGMGEDVYSEVFGGIFAPVLREYAPQVLVVSAGYDAHGRDPLGGMMLEESSFELFAATLTGLCKEIGAAPPAFVMEGGYDLDALSHSTAATIVGVENSESPSVGDAPFELTNEVRDSFSRYWSSLK